MEKEIHDFLCTFLLKDIVNTIVNAYYGNGVARVRQLCKHYISSGIVWSNDPKSMHPSDPLNIFKISLVNDTFPNNTTQKECDAHEWITKVLNEFRLTSVLEDEHVKHLSSTFYRLYHSQPLEVVYQNRNQKPNIQQSQVSKWLICLYQCIMNRPRELSFWFETWNNTLYYSSSSAGFLGDEEPINKSSQHVFYICNRKTNQMITRMEWDWNPRGIVYDSDGIQIQF